MANVGLRGFGFVCLLLLVCLPLSNWTTQNTTLIYEKSLTLAQLDSPVTIDDDDDFSTLGFPGSGTAEDPYLISNLWIEGENGISISNVNSHFMITNCILWTQRGVSIENAQHFIIQDTEFRADAMDLSTDGISISDCDDFLIRNITIYPEFLDSYSFEIGIKVIDSSNGIIENCSITNCAICVGVMRGHNFTITDNSIFGEKIGSAEGIFIQTSHSIISRNYITRASPCIVLTSSDDNIVSDNDCVAGGLGVVIEESQRNKITSNLCRNGIYVGIYVSFGSSFNIIRENRLENNDDYGIKFVSREFSIPTSNQVFRNIFISNNQGGQQAYDDNGLNGFGYNYWSDWTDQDDENNDGYYDEPYPIAGSSIFDHHPLVNESLVYSLSIDSVPVPISPRGIFIAITVFSLTAVIVIPRLKQVIDKRRGKKQVEGGAINAFCRVFQTWSVCLRARLHPFQSLAPS